jgi:D-beta-D-heptose 7-phosphate kinase/D-beta-D-heptose 1-phosphate adenosyltransferase
MAQPRQVEEVAAPPPSRIRTREQIAPICEELRRAGKRLVFTNGCFDLLHAGHVQLLERARELGDVLIVGLNGDASLRRLKGETRPLVPEGDRARILAGLRAVDYVVIFDEDTPLELLAYVRPDVLAKGGDYRAEEIIGRELVESHGGRVEVIRFVEGRSTTNLVERIRALPRA